MDFFSFSIPATLIGCSPQTGLHGGMFHSNLLIYVPFGPKPRTSACECCRTYYYMVQSMSCRCCVSNLLLLEIQHRSAAVSGDLSSPALDQRCSVSGHLS